MISCEIDPFLAEFSKPFFDRSPHGNKIDVRLGPALETMKAYDAAAEGGGCDMIFIDADKGGYVAYYEAALSTPGLLAEGGVIAHETARLPLQPLHPDTRTALIELARRNDALVLRWGR